MCTDGHDAVLLSVPEKIKPSPLPHKSGLKLNEVDEVQITIVVDNTFDMLLSSTDQAKRFPLRTNLFERPLPTAEHGYSVLIRVRSGEKSGTVLFDTGVSARGLLYNLDTLEIGAKDIQAIVL